MSEIRIAACSGADGKAPKGKRDGFIGLYRMGGATPGHVSALSESRIAPSPSFLGWSEKTSTLYVASEIGVGDGRLTALDIGKEQATERSHIETGGNASVHLSLDRTGHFAFVANYHGNDTARAVAVAAFALNEDGSIGRMTGSAEHHGHGPDPDRQKGPHCHSVMVSPDNRIVVAADLGTDSLYIYRFDPADGTIRLASELKLPPETGPRHSVFHPAKPLLYVTGELNSSLMTVSIDTATGTARLIDSIAATATKSKARNYPSGIAISPDGHYVLAANRGADVISVYWLDPGNGLAKLGHETPCGGHFPRAIRFDASARHLAVANQKSDNISIFGWDFTSGTLTAEPVSKIEIPTPLDMIFLE